MQISKLQYFYYEIGEFSNIEQRSLKETISFLNNFPWEEQRKSSFVDLNGASVTIENGSGGFLKVGLYYHGAFSLYLLNDRKKLFLKIVDTWAEVISNVSAFYEGVSLEDSFVKYFEWVRNPSRYFVTKEFEYTVTAKRVVSFLYMPVCLGLLFVFVLLTAAHDWASALVGLAAMIIPFFLFCGMNVILFFNYYRFSKKHYLKISRGNDNFYFGITGAVAHYRKQDIEWMKEYHNTRYKSAWGECYVYVIQMKNGKMLKLNSLLIKDMTFSNKFPDQQIRTIHKRIATVHNCP